MPEHKNVFISSTEIDLLEHRDAVRAVITTMGFYPSGMETWPVGDENSIDRCKRMVEEAEIYVGIYAHRYGWCPPSYGGKKSITELEYDWATAKGIPRLCFVINEDHPWPPSKIEFKAKRKLDAFKKRVQNNFTGFFTTPDNLSVQVAIALSAQGVVKELHQAQAERNVVPLSNRFIGRESELEILNKILNESQAVAITAVTGVGGIGKSTLVKEFAKRDKHFKMKLWAELGQSRSDDLLRRILRQWTEEDFPLEWSLEHIINVSREILTLRAHAYGESILLLIDDVWLETVEQARKLRDAAPINAKVLITTRSQDVAAALDAYAIRLNFMPLDQGIALMIDLIGKEAEKLRTDLEGLSAALGGHPLALTLAARLIRRDPMPMQARRVIERLIHGVESGEDFRALKLDAGDTKLDSVSVTLRLTLGTLSEERQQQFRALGVLPLDLPFRSEHAIATCGITNQDEGREMLADFTAEGLIAPVQERDGWYMQHRLLRAYARALLRQHHEFDDLRQRNYNILLTVASNIFQQPPETWKENDDDLPQIHALGNEIVALLTETDDPGKQDKRLQLMSETGTEADEDLIHNSIRFSDVVISYIFRRYVGAEGRRWLWAGLAAAKTAKHQKAIGVITSVLGSWHEQHGEQLTALDYHRKSYEITKVTGDKRNEAASLNSIAGIRGIIGEYEQAISGYEQSLSIFRELGDKRGEGITLSNIGMVWNNQYNFEKALTFFEPALALMREVGDKGGVATTLNNIGGVLQEQGFLEQALTYFEPALELNREIGDKRSEASNLNNIGRSLDRLSNAEKALPYYQEALLLYQEVDDPHGVALTYGNIALNLWNQGQRIEAIEQMEISKALRARLGLDIERQDYYLVRWHQWLNDADKDADS